MRSGRRRRGSRRCRAAGRARVATSRSSRRTARTRRVLAAAGIPVKVSDDYTPTPALSFAVKTLRTAGGIRLNAGPLYRSIQRMLEQGLIVETRERPSPEEDDERRRYYRITSDGRQALAEEAELRAATARFAQAKLGLLGGTLG